MTATTDITALIDKQLEGAREHERVVTMLTAHPDNDNGYSWEDINSDVLHVDLKVALNIIDQYQRLGKWVQHDPKCHSHELIRFTVNGPLINGKCDCGLSAKLDAIKKEIEG